MNYHSSSILRRVYRFLLDYFFDPKFASTCLQQIFRTKCSIMFFTANITNNICPLYSMFSFFNHKIFFRQIWSVSLYKNIVVFCYSYMITNFEFRIFVIMLDTILNTRIQLYIGRIHFECSMIYNVAFALSYPHMFLMFQSYTCKIIAFLQ